MKQASQWKYGSPRVRQLLLLQRRIAALLWGGRWSESFQSSVSCFKVGLCYTESSFLRSHPSQGRSYPAADQDGCIKAQPFCSFLRQSLSSLPDCLRLGETSIRIWLPTLQSCFPPLPVTGLIPTEHLVPHNVSVIVMSVCIQVKALLIGKHSLSNNRAIKYLGKGHWSWYAHAALMALGSLEQEMAHINWSRDVRAAQQTWSKGSEGLREASIMYWLYCIRPCVSVVQ